MSEEQLSHNKKIAIQANRLIEKDDEQLAAEIIHPDFINHEASDDPEDKERQENGPEGFLATGRWLRDAFSELRFEEQEVVAEGDVVMVATRMKGKHTGMFQRIPPFELSAMISASCFNSVGNRRDRSFI